jgi:hypothetical protein
MAHGVRVVHKLNTFFYGFQPSANSVLLLDSRRTKTLSMASVRSGLSRKSSFRTAAMFLGVPFLSFLHCIAWRSDEDGGHRKGMDTVLRERIFELDLFDKYIL